MQTELTSQTNNLPETQRKAYEQPAIIHELELETRAGSPLSWPPLPWEIGQ